MLIEIGLRIYWGTFKQLLKLENIVWLLDDMCVEIAEIRAGEASRGLRQQADSACAAMGAQLPCRNLLLYQSPRIKGVFLKSAS